MHESILEFGQTRALSQCMESQDTLGRGAPIDEAEEPWAVGLHWHLASDKQCYAEGPRVHALSKEVGCEVRMRPPELNGAWQASACQLAEERRRVRCAPLLDGGHNGIEAACT
mmetsp:Transcript_87573/g.265723  ORF Transcript_87573/g.265723 Transcript_87573/m.265723 type:complete len:113 (+) Transcript_87573:3068-3406(+)